MPRRKGNTGDSTALFAHFFGHFQVIVKNESIMESLSRTRRPWSLLQYLIVNRHQAIPRSQLIEALWPDGGSEQPEKALKNLVYRVRNQFAVLGLPFAQEIILYTNGTYALNNDLDWVVDFEQFEVYYKKAQDTEQPLTDRLYSYRSAIELYQGDFLSEHLNEDWVLPYNAYYRSLYFKCVEELLDILEEEEMYAEMEVVSAQALRFDRFEEELHLAYMTALVQQNKKAAAAAHYDNLTHIFFKELGVTPCYELQELYQQVSRSSGRVETDLNAIKASMREGGYAEDAFLCEFEVFRNLYRLEARNSDRVGESIFIGLLTLSNDAGEPPKSDVLNRAMAMLLEAIHSCLRRGDVVSRFSLSQYILMLPTITYENGEVVIQRVVEKFYKLSPFRNLKLDARIQPLDPDR